MASVLVLGLLLFGEQIDQQSGQAGPPQVLGDETVARTVPAAARAVREQHDAGRLIRYAEGPFERHRPGVNLDR